VPSRDRRHRHTQCECCVPQKAVTTQSYSVKN
jgi:hypothetical protein